MQDVRSFEETLAVIRRLMERGTRYEAITGPGALLAGGAALGASALLRFGPWQSDAAFVVAWTVIAVAAGSWVVVPALRASKAGDTEGRRLSAQARTVGLEVLPAYVAAVALTAALWRVGAAGLLPATWMLLHGIAILATSSHAPRRLVRLGAAFVVAGAMAGLLPIDRHLAMAAGFGGLHIAYGAISLIASRRDED